MNNITLEDIALRTYREEKSKETFNNIPVIAPEIIDRTVLIEKDKEIERLSEENKVLQSIANIEMSKSEYLEKKNRKIK